MDKITNRMKYVRYHNSTGLLFLKMKIPGIVLAFTLFVSELGAHLRL